MRPFRATRFVCLSQVWFELLKAQIHNRRRAAGAGPPGAAIGPLGPFGLLAPFGPLGTFLCAAAGVGEMRGG